MQRHKWAVALIFPPAATNDAGTRSAGNHAIGWYGVSTPPGELRNYLVFDRSAISGTISAATLRPAVLPTKQAR